MNLPLSNNPAKGANDWLPEEYAIRNYIFQTWRNVNIRFGYEEYLTPILELADIYRAKSGEDVGGKELMTMTDRAGREYAIRPEMTPSVTRMVTRIFKQANKPLRLFSIANFWRNERPQRGRNREFWQLNTDIFGGESLAADLEILQVALELMLAFNPPAGSFTLNLNHRRLIDAVLHDIAAIPKEETVAVARLLDKFSKLPQEKFMVAMAELGVAETAVADLIAFMEAGSESDLLERFPLLADVRGFQELMTLITQLRAIGYGEWVRFDPSVIRGFDYYDGMVFEIFDNHPKNNRALFGGGRYNGLANIFGSEEIPAIGFAPGDETTKLFLESWNLLPASLQQNPALFLPLLDDGLETHCHRLARTLRRAGFVVEQGLERQSFKQAFKYADRKGLQTVLILGTREAENGNVAVKSMRSGNQDTMAEEDLVNYLSTEQENAA